jgi:hypothetical protein
LNSFVNAMKGLIGTEVFVFVGLRDSTGRLGRVTEVGDDYLRIDGNEQTYYIPFAAILAVTPKK